MASPPADLTTLMSRLAAAKIEFVLVGGLAAVAQGASITAVVAPAARAAAARTASWAVVAATAYRADTSSGTDGASRGTRPLFTSPGTTRSSINLGGGHSRSHDRPRRGPHLTSRARRWLDVRETPERGSSSMTSASDHG